MQASCCTQLADWLTGIFARSLCPKFGGATVKYSNEQDEMSLRERADGSSNADVMSATSDPLVNDRLTMMAVKHSFVAGSKEELHVQAGQIVYATHEENHWVYALTQSGEHGFVPSSYLCKVDQLTGRKMKSERKVPRRPRGSLVTEDSHEELLDQDSRRNSVESKLAKSLSFGEIEMGDYDIFGYISDTSFQRSGSEQSLRGSEYSEIIEPFTRKPRGKYLVLHNYHGDDENDATILKGDCVTVLNKDDYDWYYIRTSDGSEGFVPRNYLWQATCPPDDDMIL